LTRPQVTLKLATSLDGRIALANGQSRWITGPAARDEVHRLRAAHDAVLVGAETALADDPKLTVRTGPMPAVHPLRVVLDSRFRLPLTSRLLKTLSLAPVLIVGARDSDPADRKALERAGAHTALVARGLDGLDLTATLATLADQFGVGTLFVEGGGAVATSFLKADLIDRLEWFRAPVLLGAEAKPAVAPLGVEDLSASFRFVRLGVEPRDPDLWERYARSR
jgi:diaminohydroxyphosphoribosylaminopyrimidine deaminase/5-amino-6-(5-phosphoribosylamino)uracil reductase